MCGCNWPLTKWSRASEQNDQLIKHALPIKKLDLSFWVLDVTSARYLPNMGAVVYLIWIAVSCVLVCITSTSICVQMYVYPYSSGRLLKCWLSWIELFFSDSCLWLPVCAFPLPAWVCKFLESRYVHYLYSINTPTQLLSFRRYFCQTSTRHGSSRVSYLRSCIQLCCPSSACYCPGSQHHPHLPCPSSARRWQPDLPLWGTTRESEECGQECYTRSAPRVTSIFLLWWDRLETCSLPQHVWPLPTVPLCVAGDHHSIQGVWEEVNN